MMKVIFILRRNNSFVFFSLDSTFSLSNILLTADIHSLLNAHCAGWERNLYFIIQKGIEIQV